MDSIARINRTVPPFKAYIPVTVFNSNPLLTTFPVEFECMSDYRPLWTGDWILQLHDRSGNRITCQEEQPEALLPFHRWRRKICFLAKDMGVGVHHFELRKGKRKKEKVKRKVQNTFSFFLFPFYLAIHDRSDSWGTNTWSWRDIAGRFEPVPGSDRVIEEGPVRSISEKILVWGHSKIVVHTITYADWPVTEYKIWVQWNEEKMRLKLAIPVEMQHPRLVAGIPGGSAVFPPDAQEHVHGTWMMLKDQETGDQRPKTADSHHSSLVTSHQSPVTSHESRVTSHESRVTSHQPVHRPLRPSRVRFRWPGTQAFRPPERCVLPRTGIQPGERTLPEIHGYRGARYPAGPVG